jgi:small-conductance mechanosensitive channel
MSELALGEIAQHVRTVLAHWIDVLRDPRQMWQLPALLLVLVSAWFATRAVYRSYAPQLARHTNLGAQDLTKLLFPAFCALAALIAATLLPRLGVAVGLLWLLAALTGSLLAIRVAVRVLKLVLKPGPALVASEHFISWGIWGFVALLLLGWLQPLAQAMDTLAILIGGTRVSLLDAVRTVFTVLLFVVVSAYIGTVIERRMMAIADMPIGVRVGVAKTVRFSLILLAALVAFNVVGIDLGGLTVFGGALGVGIGFGLQRIASNFVSGFILIGDRSIRPGDVITIDNRFGVVRELRARYIVVRDRDGVDTLIPNENIITSDVVNWSYADRAVRLKLPVQISYQDNPRRAMELMVQAARAHARVEVLPEPAARVMEFGESGINLELRFWIRDPEDGINNVRSDLYLAIWDAFHVDHITIPYPQRDVHVRTHRDLPPAPPEY